MNTLIYLFIALSNAKYAIKYTRGDNKEEYMFKKYRINKCYRAQYSMSSIGYNYYEYTKDDGLLYKITYSDRECEEDANSDKGVSYNGDEDDWIVKILPPSYIAFISDTDDNSDCEHVEDLARTYFKDNCYKSGDNYYKYKVVEIGEKDWLVHRTYDNDDCDDHTSQDKIFECDKCVIGTMHQCSAASFIILLLVTIIFTLL
ncbi:Uncharacterized protein QTN25_000460 [Entamoeba marina]